MIAWCAKTGSGRVKRRMPSLSIDLPMSLLRQKLNLEKERKNHALRAAANRNILNDIGKRGGLHLSLFVYTCLFTLLGLIFVELPAANSTKPIDIRFRRLGIMEFAWPRGNG